jgi:hypothetical protein
MEAEKFVREFQAAWATRSPDAFQHLWCTDGVLDHPTVSRPIPSRLTPALRREWYKLLPDLEWTLLSWGALGNTVFIEWESSAHLNGAPLLWRGIDKMTLRDGRIEREVVYSDNLYLWKALDPSMERPALIDADHLESDATPKT